MLGVSFSEIEKFKPRILYSNIVELLFVEQEIGTLMSTNVFELWTSDIPTKILNQIILTKEIVKLIIVSPWIRLKETNPFLKYYAEEFAKKRLT